MMHIQTVVYKLLMGSILCKIPTTNEWALKDSGLCSGLHTRQPIMMQDKIFFCH